MFWLPLLAGVEKLLTNQHRCTAANWDRKTSGALKKGGLALVKQLRLYMALFAVDLSLLSCLHFIHVK